MGAQPAVGTRATRDPFDRLIVGTALAEDRLLLTADATVHNHCRLARWG